MEIENRNRKLDNFPPFGLNNLITMGVVTMTKTHFYKGYALHKPEGCRIWNIHKTEKDGTINWCRAEGYGNTLKECRNEIDVWEEWEVDNNDD